MTRRINPAFYAACAVFAALAGCARDAYPHLYRTWAYAPSFKETEVSSLAHLGAAVVDQGVNFNVFSANATRIELALFNDPESNRPTRQFPMTRVGNVWSLYVEGVGIGQAYGYIAWGPNWPYDPDWYPGSIKGFLADVDGQGNRFNPNKLLFDPYSRAFTRDHDWSRASLASGPARTENTYGAAMKSVIVQSQYVWSDGETAWRNNRKNPAFPGHRAQDLILYEVHPKGFTASTASGVNHPGTYRGIGEKADYFVELGINAVELMPVMEKPLDGGYWGYQTIGFFAPELSYSFDQRPGWVNDEFKWMVDQLHQRGIEVILDVVYNHTGEGGLWRDKIAYDDNPLDPNSVSHLGNYDPKEVAGLYSFRGLDNQSYYALSKDGQTYWNNTGVGDETRANNNIVQRLILDSLHYWASEMHVDGFRFDLAAQLGEKDLSECNPNDQSCVPYNTWDDPKLTVLQQIIDDAQLQQYNTRIIAEPWAIGPYGTKQGAFPAANTKDGLGWSEWNGNFRDWWRAFVNYDSTWNGPFADCSKGCGNWPLNAKEGPADFGFLLTGSYDYFNWNGRRPYNSVNFITVHDGFTLYDAETYNQKVNGCGPLNPVCCKDPTSPFCETVSGESNNRSRDWRRCDNTPPPNVTFCFLTNNTCTNGAACVSYEEFKRQQMRNLLVGMIISRGTPLYLGGDEWMRTQLGNNNAYSTLADNSFNWFDWGSWQAADERWRMKDFVAQLNRFRAANRALFAPADYASAAPFSYKSENNDANVNFGGKHVMVHYYDSTKGKQTVVLINLETGPVTFQLPQGVHWTRIVDTQMHFDDQTWLNHSGLPTRNSSNIWLDGSQPVPGSSYQAVDHSIVILQAAQ